MIAKLRAAFVATLLAILLAALILFFDFVVFRNTNSLAIGLLQAALPLGVPWLVLRRLKAHLFSSIPYPENAVGGMVAGLAAVSWLIAVGELGGPLPWWLFLIPFSAMIIGGALAASTLKSERTLALLAGSPLIAASVVFTLGTIARHSQRPDPQRQEQWKEVQKKIQKVLEEQRMKPGDRR